MEDRGCQPARAAVLHPISGSSQSGLFAKEPCFPVTVGTSLSGGAVGGWSWGTPLGRQLAPPTLQEDPGPGPLSVGSSCLGLQGNLGVIAPFYG